MREALICYCVNSRTHQHLREKGATKMRNTILLAALIAISALPCLAQGFGNECNPVGTWYGGSDATAGMKYLLRITAGPAGRYAVTYELGFIPKIPRISSYSGEMVKTPDGYVVYSLALANLVSTPPPLGGPPPQIWAVRANMQFEGCDTLKSTIDFIGLYNWSDNVPFLDAPDVSAPLGTESYRRMPTTCSPEVCSL